MTDIFTPPTTFPHECLDNAGNTVWHDTEAELRTRIEELEAVIQAAIHEFENRDGTYALAVLKGQGVADSLLDHIEELQAQLVKVEAERDEYDEDRKKWTGKWMEAKAMAEAAEAQLAKKPKGVTQDSFNTLQANFLAVSKELAKVTAERDRLHELKHQAEKDRDAFISGSIAQEKRADAAEYALSRAYRMGLEDAVSECKLIEEDSFAPLVRSFDEAFKASAMRCGHEISAIPVPTDLVERITKEIK